MIRITVQVYTILLQKPLAMTKGTEGVPQTGGKSDHVDMGIKAIPKYSIADVL